MRQFLELLFDEMIGDADMDILEAATAGAPGVARLRAAQLGEAQPEAPNSRPVFSAVGGKIGFVADEEMLVGPPYDSTYWITA